jgi:hypothetical protein
VIGTREDAMNTLTMIDPDEAMSLAVLARTTTNGLRHEWFTDSMQATASGGALIGEDWGATAAQVKTLKPRIRLTNWVQFFRHDFSIVMDEILLSRRGQIFGVQDEVNYQTGKAGQEVNRNVDARLWSNTTAATGATGSDSVAPLLSNFRAWAAASGIVTHVSGAFATSHLYNLHETMWASGAKPDTLFVSPGVKVDISRTLLGDIGYATGVPSGGLGLVRNSDAVAGGEYGPVIDFIRTDFGRLGIVVDRWIPQAAATTSTTADSAAYFLVEKSKLRVAWWRPIQPYQVASTGDNVKLYCLGACTVEVLHPTCIGLGYNVTT